MATRTLLLLFLSVIAALFPISSPTDTLVPSQLFSDGAGASLVSSGEKFKLGFFSPDGTDGNRRYVGIWYNTISAFTVVWVANRQRPLTNGSGHLALTENGTLVIFGDDNSTVVWSAQSAKALANPVAQLLDTGNLVVREATDESADDFAWKSFDFPTDTLLPGMKIGWDLRTRLNRNLTAWKSDDDPSPGSYTLGIDLRGVPQQFGWRDGQPYWRAGPWNGAFLSGVPAMESKAFAEHSFIIDQQEVVHCYSSANSSLLRRLTILPTGVVEGFAWTDENQLWSSRGYVPGDPCDAFSSCGPNALCYPNWWPLCRCLHGFDPKNPTAWQLMTNTSDGCTRRTELDCVNGTDRFWRQSNVKLPDTSSSLVDRRTDISLDDCKAWCLGTCSCTAYARANISGGGSGCILWTTDLTDIKLFNDGLGQDLYVRLSAGDFDRGSSRRGRKRIIIVAVTSAAALTILVLLGVVAGLCVNRKKLQVNQVTGEDFDLPLFDLGTMSTATCDFSIDNKLGEGGFGPVYKGKLGEKQQIAVKRLSETSLQGIEEFKNEVTLIAKLQHRNLVRLLGCCIEGDEKMLVYEYLPNGSLDTFLFSETKRKLLDWEARYRIIVEIARGLHYLHHDSRFRIVHRDLKASNILLDEDLNPKISDFGMAKIFSGDETIGKTRRVVGTYGYMSPEYIKNGAFSVKSDIFSFGVLMLEIISGKKNTEFCHSSQHLNLLDFMWSLWREEKALDSIDESMGLFPVAEVLRCINIGLLCVQERAEDRPTTSSILLMLGNDKMYLSQPKQPGFVIERDPCESYPSSKKKSLSINYVSITTLEVR
ncbi:G-type lectin S-receptor-like serine/threonine-protein kinase At4g27290 [Curcuma longa]|uniref:G-type lectin S-receptor-like serine/threonine-protein kinase At4g27290 n=1 Tax=Curcuma longa TaxID=136217 RepID=UPI003D9DB3DA